MSQRCSSLTAKHLPCCCCCCCARLAVVVAFEPVSCPFASHLPRLLLPSSNQASKLARCRVAAAASQQAQSSRQLLPLSLSPSLLTYYLSGPGFPPTWSSLSLAQLKGQRPEACLPTDILLPSHHPSLVLAASAAAAAVCPSLLLHPDLSRTSTSTNRAVRGNLPWNPRLNCECQLGPIQGPPCFLPCALLAGSFLRPTHTEPHPKANSSVLSSSFSLARFCETLTSTSHIACFIVYQPQY